MITSGVLDSMMKSSKDNPSANKEKYHRSGQIQSDGQTVPQAYHRCCRILPDLAADNDVLAEF